MKRPLSPAAQAKLPLRPQDLTVIDHYGQTITVGVQNIVVARIDVQELDGPAKTALSLCGVKKVRELIQALALVEVHMIREQALLDEMMGRTPAAEEAK